MVGEQGVKMCWGVAVKCGVVCGVWRLRVVWYGRRQCGMVCGVWS